MTLTEIMPCSLDGSSPNCSDASGEASSGLFEAISAPTRQRIADDTLMPSASQLIDELLGYIEAALRLNPDQRLEDWSIRVSIDGIEIESCPAGAWMKGRDWDCPGFVYDFEPDDTLARLRSVIIDNRDSLAGMVVFYDMRRAGFAAEETDEDFIRALDAFWQGRSATKVQLGDLLVVK
jgi:hypothetical protein